MTQRQYDIVFDYLFTLLLSLSAAAVLWALDCSLWTAIFIAHYETFTWRLTMSHREKSLTPWITNETHGNPAKDRECIRRTGQPCVRIPPSLYDAMEARGGDMSGYVAQEPMPPLPETDK